MAGFIPEEVIAEIRERTDIVQIVGQYVQLKRSGSNFKGCCPFHNEKTPSFNVNAQRRFYHCFGCHESGDVISFLMKIEGRRFVEVVQELAERAGIELPKEKFNLEQQREAERRKSEKQRGLELNRRVADLYRQLLIGEGGQPAREYLKTRGISQETAATFSLGYAPTNGNVVVRLLETEKIPLDFAAQLGLIKRRQSGEGYHDSFWNRLMFPVLGTRGEVLGFGGRLLGDGDGPKYINTPETALYHKGEVVFGLGPAASAMRQKRQAIIVEGNIDVLMMYQCGLPQTVAPMGTALTAKQVELIGRFAENVVAVFDGDEAGQAAARKSVPMFIAGGLSAKIAKLPAKHDPDSFLRAQGSEAMTELLDKAPVALDFYLQDLLDNGDGTLPAKARVVEQVSPLIAQLSSQVEQDLYVGRLAMSAQVEQSAVRRAMRREALNIAQSQSSSPTASNAPGHSNSRANSNSLAHSGSQPFGQTNSAANQLKSKSKAAYHPPQVELDLLGVLIENPHLFSRAEQFNVPRLLSDADLLATYTFARSMQQEGELTPSTLLGAIPDVVRSVVAETILSGKFSQDALNGDPTRALDDCIAALRRRQLQQDLVEVRGQLTQARQVGESMAIRELTQRLIEVEREIHETR